MLTQHAKRAWLLMKGGFSLQEAAHAIDVDPIRLDKAIWTWRGLQTRSVAPR